MFAGYFDFISYSAQSDGNKPRHGGLPTSKVVTPLLNNSRDTTERQDTGCMANTSDSNKITIDKNQLARLVQMAISHSKTEQREKKEAEMR